jgi:deoxyribonuclease-4
VAAERIGLCLDTCHLFAAGYDLRSVRGYRGMMRELESCLGIDRVAAVHLNDSRQGLGSRVDRHEHIGEGQIGLRPFGFFLNDPRFHAVPMILETPKGDDLVTADRQNLARLRALLNGAGRGRRP